MSPADLDADGRTDLVVANRFAETVTVLLNLDLEDGPTEIPSDLAPLLNGPESTSRAVHDRSLFDLASEGDKMISDLGRKRRFPVCDAENPS